MRTLQKLIAAALAVIVGAGLTSRVAGGETPNAKSVAARHSSTADTATIRTPGLKTRLLVLHIADAHISIPSADEAEHRQYSARMDNAYGQARPHYQTKQPALPAAHFRALMALAKQRKVDLMALTGDIVNNPAQSSVEYVRQALRETGIRSLYIAGNHDWHYEGLPGTDDALRETWTKKRLSPLYAGRDPLCAAARLGGLNFVAIDNSTYQVTVEQLAFYEKQLAIGLPTVLLLHIPIWLPQNAAKHVSDCGDPRWGWDADSNYEIERRERWSKSGNRQSTLDFAARVRQPGALIAVLAGHTHRARTDPLSDSAVQYVTRAACDGAYRLVVFEPEADSPGK